MRKRLVALIVQHIACWIFCLSFLPLQMVSAQVRIAAESGQPDPSAMLEVQSDDSGILVPRMTHTQRDGISAPAEGLLLYQTDGQAGFYVYDGTGWRILLTASDGYTGMIQDVDGNAYRTVRIGTQEWMAENLRTTHYSNGDAISDVSDNGIWNSMTTGAYCWYDNDENANKSVYGALYNFYAATDGHNVCPTGWHVPSKAEFEQLKTYLGGATAGGQIKAALHWNIPNTGASNASGFSLFGAGYRDDAGTFIGLNNNGLCWSSTAYDQWRDWRITVNYNSADLFLLYDLHTYGCSIRCVRSE